MLMSGTSGRAYLVAFAGVVLGCLTGLISCWVTMPTVDSTLAVWAISCVPFCTLLVTAFVKEEPVSPLALFLAGYGLYYVLPSLGLVTGILPDEGLRQVFPLGAIVQNLGLMSFFSGYVVAGHRRFPLRLLPDKLNAAKVAIFGGALGLVGLVGVVLQVGSSGWSSFFTTPIGQREIGILWAMILPATMLILSVQIERMTKLGVSTWVQIGLQVALLGIFLAFYTIARRYLVAVVVFAAIYYHLRKSRIRWRNMAVLGIVLLSSMVFLGALRGFVHLGSLPAILQGVREVFSQAGLAYILGRLDVINYNNFLMILDQVPKVHGYLLGTSYLKLLLAPIPRSLTPWKPESITRLVVYVFRPEYSGTNLSQGTTVFGEMFWNLGYPCVLLASIAWGAVCRVLWNTAKRAASRGSPAWVIVYSGTAFSLVLEQFRGGFSNIALNLSLFYLIPLICALTWAGERS